MSASRPELWPHVPAIAKQNPKTDKESVTRGLQATLLSVLLMAAACTSPPDERPLTWEAKLAWAACSRAEDFLARGDAVRAREVAWEALMQARSAGYVPAEARALALLGQIDENVELLGEAVRLAEGLASEGLRVETDLALATALADDGRGLEALPLLDQTLETTAGWNDRTASARAEARAHHLRATILRQIGQQDAAASAERQAFLSLTLVPGTEQGALRLAVLQSVGDGYALARQDREAFEFHSRASVLSQQLGDRGAEGAALHAMARDLTRLGRPRDAVHHSERALSAALEVGDTERAQLVAREALGLLHEIDEPADSARFQRFRNALFESS